MKEKLKNVPHFAWYFIALVFVILVMDIKNLPPEVEKYIFIEDIQKASEKQYKTEDYSLEYYSTKEQFITAMESDFDVTPKYYDYIIEKIEDPAKNRRYAKLTLYYDVSTYYTVRHNVWLTIRTNDGKPASVFEVLLSRMDLDNLFMSRSVDGRTYVLNHTKGRMEVYAGFTVYPDAVQKIVGVDDVYYTSLLSDAQKERYPLQYQDEMEHHRYYRQSLEIRFMEME